MIVLIPGWTGFRAGLIPLEQRLRRRLDREVLRADVGLGLGCIRRSAENVAEQIARSGATSGVDIIGHSMGGLVGAYLLKCVDRGATIRSVITLGSPHRGSPMLFVARGAIQRVSASLAQMIPGSELLIELSRREVPLGSRLVSVASGGDGIVPERFAELPRRPRQFTCRVPDVSHVGYLFSRPVLDAILSWLARGEMCLVRSAS